MESFLKMTTAAAALAGSALCCAPANAAYVGIGVGPIGFDIHSGGCCDQWGCPGDYWTYPISYGPVYYDNAWYRGPVYYRTVNGAHWYWIHGAWHRDQWRGPRPTWARDVRYGRPLGLDYYRAHGFRVRDEDWRAWRDRDYRTRTGYREDNRGGSYANGDRIRDYDHDTYDRDRNRDEDRGAMDRDRTYDRGYDHDYDRDRGTYEHSGYDRDRYRTGPDGQSRDHGNSGPSDQTRDRDRSPGTENGYEKTRYQQPVGEHGHVTPPPPSRSTTKPKSNPDAGSGPGD